MWASDVKRNLEDIEYKKKCLNKQEKEIRELCNHTNQDGSSAIVIVNEECTAFVYENVKRCQACGVKVGE
jgi:hypothetical protein